MGNARCEHESQPNGVKRYMKGENIPQRSIHKERDGNKKSTVQLIINTMHRTHGSLAHLVKYVAKEERAFCSQTFDHIIRMHPL